MITLQLLGLLVLRPSIYKVRQLFLLQSAMVCYKVRQFFYYKVRQVLLQSATGITKCDNFITRCDRYYKVRRLLQSTTEHRSSPPLVATRMRQWRALEYNNVLHTSCLDFSI